MQQSPEINALAAALAKAQGEIKAAIKSQTNPFFKSTYANLSDAWDACREALSKNGLAVTQVTEKLNDHWVLITTLMHSSGQWQRGEYPLICAKQDAQGFGSGVTYARRYSFMAIVGIAPEDDDGNKASDLTHRSSHSNSPPMHSNGPPPSPPFNPDGDDAIRPFGPEDFNFPPIEDSVASAAKHPPVPPVGNSQVHSCGKKMIKDKYKEGCWYCFDCQARVPM